MRSIEFMQDYQLGDTLIKKGTILSHNGDHYGLPQDSVPEDIAHIRFTDKVVDQFLEFNEYVKKINIDDTGV